MGARLEIVTAHRERNRARGPTRHAAREINKLAMFITALQLRCRSREAGRDKKDPRRSVGTRS